MGASSGLPHKVEGSWRGREKQQEEKQEEKQLREERMREENIRIYRAGAKGFVSMKHRARERADPWEASGGAGLGTGQCWGWHVPLWDGAFLSPSQRPHSIPSRNWRQGSFTAEFGPRCFI